MNSSALQNPSDPDAIYRNKSGKLYRGYAANIEETVGRNGSVVTDYQFDKNTHTDLDKLPRGKQRGKFFFGSKIAALNFRKLFGFRKGLGNYARNPVLS